MNTLPARHFQFNTKNRNTIGKFLENLGEIHHPEPRFDLQIPQSVTSNRLEIVQVYYLQWVTTYLPLHVHNLQTPSGIDDLN